MRKLFVCLIFIFGIISNVYLQTENGLKVFISVDMEGISGVVNWEDVNRDGKDYNLFRSIMTDETNAAIEGAIAGGASEIIVRDSHGSARNILPNKLDPRAKLIRDWSGGIKGMMEGIDKTFDAVIFIGYHAKAGTPDAILDHTNSSVKINDMSINGISLPEAGLNALIAGYYNVPVAFVAGDLAICKQVKKLFGEVATVAVKEGIGNAALCLHPEIAQNKIRKGVKQALQKLGNYKAYKLSPPYNMVIRLFKEEWAKQASNYPGAKRTGDWECSYTSSDILDIVNAFNWMH
ncbi:M55 family metallopeptidase [Bacteroidota bacterium]